MAKEIFEVAFISKKYTTLGRVFKSTPICLELLKALPHLFRHFGQKVSNPSNRILTVTTILVNKKSP